MRATRSAAEERLLDAVLVQVFGHDGRDADVGRGELPAGGGSPNLADAGAVVGASRPSLAARRAKARVGLRRARAVRSESWLAAALIVLGVGVVTATALWLRPEHPGRALQDRESAPLPPVVVAQDAAALASLPAGTANLSVRLVGPAELRALLRFPRLRRLQLLPDPALPDPNRVAAWSSPEVARDHEALTALASLGELEVLDLPFDFALHPRHLPPLRRLARLHALALAGGDVARSALGEAIVALPALRDLRLVATPIDASFFAALGARSPRRLALHACPGFDDAAWAALGRLTALRRLEVTCQNGGGVRAANEQRRLGTLDESAFAAFAALPELRELLLDESQFDDRMLLRLPAALELLDLGQRPMDALAADALRRLGNLRDLTFGCGLEAAPAADLIGVLSLRRLDYRGRDLEPRLLRAIAAQPDLVELSLRIHGPDVDLSPLQMAPRLELLEVHAWSAGGFGGPREGPELQQFAPLSGCRALRRLRLVDCGLSGVDELLQHRVTIEAVEHL